MTPSTTHLILIPSYNPGPSLASTIRAVLEHWSPVWIVDDGSTDESTQTVQRIAESDSRVRVIVRPQNGGKGAASNKIQFPSNQRHLEISWKAGIAAPLPRVSAGLGRPRLTNIQAHRARFLQPWRANHGKREGIRRRDTTEASGMADAAVVVVSQ